MHCIVQSVTYLNQLSNGTSLNDDYMLNLRFFTQYFKNFSCFHETNRQTIILSTPAST